MKSSMTPTINITNVILSCNETFQWTFSGLNVNISRCRLDPVPIVMEPFNNTEYLIKEPEILIPNSSFGNLDLKPGTKALITDCYIDAEFKDRPTLITGNNSDVSIQNCHFENFVNQNDSTILFGYNNSHVTIENSIFNQHNSSKGVLFLQNNSSLRISSSLISDNVAFTLGYSTITLFKEVNTFVRNTLFMNNSAIDGGVTNVEEQCQVTLTNCTFSYNKAVTAKTLTTPKNQNSEKTTNNPAINRTLIPSSPNQTLLQNQKPKFLVERKQNISKRSTRSHLDPNNIRTFAPIIPTLFNESSSRSQTTEVLLAKTINNRNERPVVQNNTGTFAPIAHHMSSDAKEPDRNTTYQTILRNNVGLDFLSRGVGGAVFVAGHSQFIATNCTFADNIAQSDAGTIFAGINVTLDIQKTTFVGNKAWQGGAIDVQEQVQLSITNCTFADNSAQSLAGTIGAAFNVTLDLQETIFERNKALVYDGGAINVQEQVELSITNCIFKDNSAQFRAGAIFAGFNVTPTIRETKFVGNKAVYGGAIEVQQHLYVTNCVFKDNSAQVMGGAIITANKVTLNLQGALFVGNEAVSGGAIYALQDVTLTMQETTFVGNKALKSGGALIIDRASYLQATDCVFDNNRCKKNGGAIKSYFNAAVDIRITSFTGNSAWQSGAIDIGQQGYLRATNCAFEDNRAEDIGGAIAGGPDAVLQIHKTNFTGNSAIQGGAINVQQQANLFLTKCRLDGNFASDSGGAIETWYNVTLEIQETNFTGNSAFHYGGAMFISQSQCHAQLCLFHKNTAQTAGGAVLVQSKSVMQIETTDFANNNSTNGGAIDIEKYSNLQANECIFWENFAKQDGGAIISDSYASAVIENCYFLANRAWSGSGGAIILHLLGQTSIRGTFFLRNEASNAGGAIAIIVGTTVIIDNITCVRNSAAGDGGCLVIYSVTLTLSNSEISENVGHGFGASVGGTNSKLQVSYLSCPIVY